MGRMKMWDSSATSMGQWVLKHGDYELHILQFQFQVPFSVTMEQKHATSSVFPCDLCAKTCPTPAGLARHKRFKHLDIIVPKNLSSHTRVFHSTLNGMHALLTLFFGVMTQPQLDCVMRMVFFFRNRQCLRCRPKMIGIPMTGHLSRTVSLLTGPITTT